ncbi:MAG TPA: D-tyrosyl-tRNA(Tyr) deacylase [Deltaproteobacteria bacterium]|nr:D-tyrosyl-tRNA(Tyr) deacylase [Deltaproteobacteria bacterium]
MRAVIQRVCRASVGVAGEEVSRIGFGLCCLVGVERSDTDADIEIIARKICSLRIFEDAAGLMNLDVAQVSGDILVISQFTLFGDARKGRRPSYTCAEEPERAQELFCELVEKIRGMYPSGRVETGIFQAAMDVSLINHGPVTLLLDSRKNF